MAKKNIQQQEFDNDLPDSIHRDLSFLEYSPSKDKVEKKALKLHKAGFGVGIETQEASYKEDVDRYRVVYWD